MEYYTDLFSPETYQAFSNSKKSVSGFRKRQKSYVERLEVGDKLFCYITRISRWVGVLEVESKCFENNEPIFFEENDPFVIRVKVKPLVWLPLENAIPIHADFIWNKLSFTKDLPPNSVRWTGMVRNSLNRLIKSDGMFLMDILSKQKERQEIFPLTQDDLKKIKGTRVRTKDKEVEVVVPENEQIEDEEREPRESMKIQALIANIGERMGLKVWLPRNDRSRVLLNWAPDDNTLLENLPLNYDDTTLKTIENIDVIWIRGRSIVRAFEVEHTTSIYSGILRMADLMALQPNLNIRAHIIAPEERKEKVLDEIRRPVFSLLEKGPLAESCTFISYESIRELANERSLEHMRDTVLENYEEHADEI